MLLDDEIWGGGGGGGGGELEQSPQTVHQSGWGINRAGAAGTAGTVLAVPLFSRL